MKQVFLSVAMLCCLPATAQKWEAGINSGILIDAHGNKFFPKSGGIKNTIAFTYGAKFMRTIHQFQLGAAVDVTTLDGGSVGNHIANLYYMQGSYGGGTIYTYNGNTSDRL